MEKREESRGVAFAIQADRDEEEELDAGGGEPTSPDAAYREGRRGC
jgi:hypothetical protein